MSEDAHYLIAASFVVISAEDREAVEVRESLCRGSQGDERHRRGDREGQEMKSTPLYSTRCEGCGGVKCGLGFYSRGQGRGETASASVVASAGDGRARRG